MGQAPLTEGGMPVDIHWTVTKQTAVSFEAEIKKR